jgi:hypothetical protein
MGRGFLHSPPCHAESRRVLHLPGVGLDCSVGLGCARERDGPVHPDNFCDPESGKYREKYADIARRPVPLELDHSWGRARKLGLHFETVTFERRHVFNTRSTLEM